MATTGTAPPKKRWDARHDAVVTGWQFIGVAALMLVMGPLAVWAGTTSDKVGTVSTAVAMRQPLGAAATNLLPANIQLWIVTILGIAFIVFGLILLVSGFQSLLFGGRASAQPKAKHPKKAPSA